MIEQLIDRYFLVGAVCSVMGGIPDELMVITVVTSRGKKCCHAEITYLVTRFSCRAGPLRGPNHIPRTQKEEGPGRTGPSINNNDTIVPREPERVKKPE